MKPLEAIARLGGTTTREAILELISARALNLAIEAGEIVRDGHGRYSHPSVSASRHAANAVTGVVSHLSAAQLWGWELKSMPERHHVTVPRKRRVTADRRSELAVHWADLKPDEVVRGVTTPARTLIDCLTTSPFDVGLAVADSALRHDAITRQQLLDLVADLGGRGSGTARRVAAKADGRAANPFESVLRAIALGVPHLNLVPQVQLGIYRPDLVDVDRRLVLEADSHTWHSSRDALRRDCRRYNALVLAGWTVLRFTWEDVMFQPTRVLDDLLRVVEQALPRKGARKRA